MNSCLNCGKPVKNKYCNNKCQGQHLAVYFSNLYRGKKRLLQIEKTSICENCKISFTYIDAEKHPEQRFCSDHCSRSYSSLVRREETNKKISLKLKGRPASSSSFKSGYDSRRKPFTKKDWDKAIDVKHFIREKRIQTLPFEELKFAEKLSLIKLEQNNKCAICNLDIWNNQTLKLEIHHIDGNKFNIIRENLQFLCPNCHSQTKTYCRKKSSL